VHFTALTLPGAWLIELDRRHDDRGSFARTFCRDAFEAQGLVGDVRQCSISANERAGTLRGIHFQVAPKEEVKLVRCIRGAAWDVIVDLRPESPTFLRWEGVELTHASGRSVYVPRRFGHGFITLEDDTELLYQITPEHDPACARGIRHDDASLAIDWPIEPVVISDRDRAWPTFDAAKLSAPVV
jgi:dTDP-4-dehydrorhamnose 3,5-epimerase